ncbi:MAG: lysophospholipase [Myxococcaceae bacterium]|nr:lysophospholipase [Myxococcaceae bacterium]
MARLFRRWWPVSALVGLLVVVPAAVAARAYHAATLLLRPHRGPVAMPTGWSGGIITQWTTPSGVRLSGWYFPSTNGAAVVLAHGMGANRLQLAPELEALRAQGFGVASFDEPGQGESEGQVTWGEAEREALATVVDFVAKQPDATGAIGVLGFSVGGSAAVRVAAEDLRVRALVLCGTWTSLEGEFTFEFGRWGALSRWPALWALQRHGIHREDVQPIVDITHIAPRPVLVVTGGADEVVPQEVAEALFSASKPPHQLKTLPGAHHGDYAQSPEYLPLVTGFFARTLLAK